MPDSPSQLSGRQAREAFHLILMDELGTRLDRDLWVVKGGVNLRVFFNSVRYSEDIDLDVLPVKRQAVRNQLRQILKSEQFLRRLRAVGIQSLVQGEKEISKDTATTLRFGRQVVVGGVPYSTTIEVSFREPHPLDGREWASVHARFTDAYLGTARSVLAPHYVRGAALAQKLDALANRTAVQARDVFDICWLVRESIDSDELNQLAQRTGEDLLQRASTRALEIPFVEYRDKVLEYLDPADVEPYSSEEAWLAQQIQVVDLTNDLLARLSRGVGTPGITEGH